MPLEEFIIYGMLHAGGELMLMLAFNTNAKYVITQKSEMQYIL